MTEARRVTADKLSSGSNVLRPMISRWMPGWVRGKQSPTRRTLPEANEPGNVHTLHGAPRSAETTQHSADTEQAARLTSLRDQYAAIIADCAQWEERCQTVEINLDRALEQKEQASSRLSLSGESIPDDSCNQPSALQESYQNFATVAVLQEQKLERAKQKVASLQGKCANILAEVLALSPDPRAHTDQDDLSDLKHAA